jgi:hypothetical protein
MKKWISVVVGLLLIVAMTACSSGNAGTDSQTNPPSGESSESIKENVDGAEAPPATNEQVQNSDETREDKLPEASESPMATAVPEASESPKVTAAAEIGESPKVTAVPEISESPKVTAEPEVSESPKAIAEPKLIESPEPTVVPKSS